MLKKKYFLFILLSLNFFYLHSQIKEIEYAKKITISDGLAHNGISSLLEDSNGFLWIGTYQGINKYDGFKLITFKNTKDKDILTSNRVRAISEDAHKNLWIGTDHGLTIYNLEQETFYKAYFNSDFKKGDDGLSIIKIIFSKKNDVVYCLTEGNGVLIFNSEYQFIKQILHEEESLKNAIFSDAYELANGGIIFSSSKGLFLYNLNDEKNIQKVLDQEITSSNAILKVNKNIFIASLLNGIAIIHLNKKNEFVLKKKLLLANSFNSIKLDTQENLWLGTLENGIIKIENFNNYLNSEFKKPLKIKKFTDYSERLRISSIIHSSNSNIWVSTFNKGLYQFNTKENVFKTYQKNQKEGKEISTNGVSFISKYDKNSAIIVNASGDINLFNTKTNTFDPLPFKLPSNFKIGAAFVDSKKNIWLKVNGKDDLFLVKNGKSNLEKIGHKVLKNSDKYIFRSFSEDKNNNIWASTTDNVYKISVDNNTNIKDIESLNSNPFFKNNKLKTVRYVYADYLKNYVWIGSAQGLYRVSNKNKVPLNNQVIDKYTKDENSENAISSNFVTSILRLPNEELWISTENGGICKVLEKNNSLEFVSYTEKEGLSNNATKSILFDNEHGLWVSTNIGLNKFDLKSKQFRKFNLADGLPFEDFWFASEKLDNGVLFFSGLNSFCYFNPEEVIKTEKLPQTYLNNLKIYNKIVKPGDTINGRILLTNSISKEDKITLNYNENVFSFDLISLHFSNPKNHTIII